MPVYTNPSIDQEPTPKQLFYVDNKCAIFTCNGSPEGVILANTGSIAISDNAAIYKKTTDDVNTGWIELSAAITSGVPRAIAANITPVGNTNATLQSLQSLVVPADSLRSNGDYLYIIQAGNVATVGPHNRRWVSNFGGQIIRDTGNVNLTDNAHWNILTTIMRITATSVVATINADWGQSSVGATNFFSLGWTSTLAVSDLNANPQTILLQAQDANGTANNIRQLFTTCEIFQF